MRWLAKAALQRTLGALPQGERLNYVFQRHVLQSFPVGDAAYRQKFTRAANHLAAYEEHSPDVPASDATFFEFGAGWDLAIPLSYALLGVGRQIVIDIRPSARIELDQRELRRRRVAPALAEHAAAKVYEGVGEESLPVRLAVRGDRVNVEAVVGATEAFALAQDGRPRKPRLIYLKHQTLEERRVVREREAILAVVVRFVQRVVRGECAVSGHGLCVPESLSVFVESESGQVLARREDLRQGARLLNCLQTETTRDA